jgi:uncharacterized SAM-binding protein YcdF (DUF218 family)
MNNISDRKNSAELPAVKELETILEQEAKRPVAPGKENKHFASFELFIRWLELIGLPTEILNQNLTWQELVIFGAEAQSQIASRTLCMIQDGNTELEDLMRDITKYLGEEDTPQPSDVIFVFGSKSLARIEAAVNLYKQGLAPKIFISGGMPIYEKRKRPEAIIFKEWAIEHGVPSESIVTHDTAISVPDNVRGGLNMMDQLGLPYNSIILVTVWFAMKRSWAHMMKYVPQNTKLYRVNSTVTPTGNFAPNRWWKNEVGIKTIFNEFGKLKISEVLNSS